MHNFWRFVGNFLQYIFLINMYIYPAIIQLVERYASREQIIGFIEKPIDHLCYRQSFKLR